MSERITEAELREFDSGPQDDEVSRYEVQRLVDELRRLRGLIADGVYAFMYAPDDPKDPDKAPDEWTQLALEARAIWEEQGRG
jgi:hypothetical protein